MQPHRRQPAARRLFALGAPHVRPVAERARAGKMAFEMQHRSEGALLKQAAQPHRRAAETPVVPDSQHDAGVAAGSRRRPAARRGKRERLFDEDMPAGPRGGHDLFGMQRVRRGDQHGLDRRIGQRVGEHGPGGAAEVPREGRALPGIGRDAGDEVETGDMAGRAGQLPAPPAQPDRGNSDRHGLPPPNDNFRIPPAGRSNMPVRVRMSASTLIAAPATGNFQKRTLFCIDPGRRTR